MKPAAAVVEWAVMTYNIEEMTTHLSKGGPALQDQTILTLSDLARIGEQIPGGYFVYRSDPTQELLYLNGNTLKIFGCETPEEFRELTGNTFSGMVHPDDRERVQRSIDEQIADSANEQLDNVEYRILKKDGELRWVDDYGRFTALEGVGRVFSVFITDVTEKRRAQEQRLHMELDLEREKRESEIKSEFLFHISHDIRTPLNAILGFAELLKRHPGEPDKQAEYIGHIRQSGSQLLMMIDDLLDLSRLEQGRLENNVLPCALAEKLDDIVSIFRPQAKEKQITLIEENAIPDGRVLLDGARFTRVISNLMDNALKFTPAGGHITVSAKKTEVSDSGYARYVFSIADTGIGMAEGFLKDIYKPFEQEVNSTRSGQQGVGVGLSIVKRLLDIMGGSIQAESEKGKGSVFTIFLPLKEVNGEAAPQKTGEPEPEAAPRAEGQHRILLVEDIEINRMLAETVLEEAGFQGESVADGSDAVEIVRDNPLWYYDLVLMDIQMPVMNGYEATRAIRALPRADVKDMLIIALSANASEEDKKMSLQSGMDHHIAKPFDVASLIATINEHVCRKKEAVHGTR